MKTKAMKTLLATVFSLLAMLIISVSASAAFVGDVIGDDNVVNASDARIILRASVGLETLTEEQKLIADADGNEKITASDARIVLRTGVGLEELKHYYKKTVKVEPTCTMKAVYTYTCTECDDVYDVDGEALGHDLSVIEVVTPVTCETDGLEKHSCSRCEYSEDVTVPLGHIWNIPKATCTESMYCSRGEHYGDMATGHSTDWGTCTSCNVFITDKYPEAAETIKTKYDEAVANATSAYSLIEDTQTAASWLRYNSEKAEPYYKKALSAYTEAFNACADIPELAQIKALLSKNIENINGILKQIDVIKKSTVHIDSSNYFTFVTPIDDLNFMNKDSVIDTNKALSKLILWTSAL